MPSDHIYDTSTIDRATAYKIHRMARLLRVHLSNILKTRGLEISAEQWYVVFRLYEQPALSQSDLADKELNDHPNITRMIDALEKRNWVIRTPDPQDRRRHLIALTAYGRTEMHAMLPIIIEARRQLFAGIGDEEIAQFSSILERIERNMLNSS